MSAEFINVFQNDTLQNCQRNYINIFNPRISLKFREASVNQHAKHASHQFLTRVLQNIDEGILQFEEDLQDLEVLIEQVRFTMRRLDVASLRNVPVSAFLSCPLLTVCEFGQVPEMISDDESAKDL